MTSSYHGVIVNQCNKSESTVLSYLKERLCRICHRIPLSLIRDRMNQSQIYCEECFMKQGIKNSIRITKDEKEYLNRLIIDCKLFCGKTFSFENREEIDDHELNCKNVIGLNSLLDCNFTHFSSYIVYCNRCNSIIDSPSHDCIVNLKNKINCNNHN